MLNDKSLLSSDCPKVVQELDLTKPGLLEASAGTGKTYAIEHLILRLLLESDELDLKKILVLTFTEKATGELKEKIRSRITKRLAQGNLSHAQHIRLKEAISNFDQASIFTIHGFCESVLKKYAFENHDLFQNDLEKNDASIYGKVLKEEMRSTWVRDANENAELRTQFFDKIAALKLGTKKTWDEVILKLAGEFNPLRGDIIEPHFSEVDLEKIETEMFATVVHITHLLPDLTNSQYDEYPFYRKFCAQIFQSKPEQAKSPQIMREALKLVFRFEEKKHEEKLTSILNLFEFIQDQIKLLKFKKDGFSVLQPVTQSETDPFFQSLKQIVSLLNHLKNNYEAHLDLLNRKTFIHLKQTVIDLKQKSQEYKTEKGIITFSDMIEKVWMVLNGNETRIQILRHDFKYCIVDEFQDTDPQQWEIFKQVFLNSDSKNPLYLIGDPKQAIYRFRGGDIYTYMDARKSLYTLSQNGKAQGVGLEINFRSSPQIIEACNTVFSHTDWFKTLATYPGDQHWKLSHEPDPLGYVPVQYGGLGNQEAIDQTENPLPVIIKDFSKKLDQKKGWIKNQNFTWIASEIIKLMQSPEKLMLPDKVTGMLRPLNWNDICILVRTGTEKKQVYKHCLEYGIPVQMERHNGLYTGDAAGQILAVLEATANPLNMSKQARALFTLFFRKNSEPARSVLPEAPAELITRCREYAEQKKWPTLFYELIYESGLLARIRELENAEQLLMDFNHLSQNLTQLALTQNLSLTSLIILLVDLRNGTNLEVEADYHRENSEGEKVALMTLHISKGLEFPVVFLTGFSSGVAPKYFKIRRNLKTIFQLNKEDNDSKNEYEADNKNEDKRLFYVALTRAKYKLYLPILPANKGKTKYGPLGGFVADALRSAAQLKPNLFSLVSSEDNEIKLPPQKLTQLSVKSNGSKNTQVQSPSERKLPLPDFSKRRRKLSSYSLLAKYGVKATFEVEEGRLDKDESPPEILDIGEELDINTILQIDAIEKLNTANTLPRGREIGNMFHEILEQLTFSEIGNYEKPDEMIATPKICEIIQSQMQKHDIELKWLNEIAAVIWNTLNALLPDPSGGEPFKLSQVIDLKPEMEFLFPYSFVKPHGDSQGFLNGFIDLVFRYGGKYYFLDWKSNFIENYDTVSLEKSMRESSYDLQYKLYAIAIHRWLKSLIQDFNYDEHFGGIYYLYLRGLQGSSQSTPISTNHLSYAGVYALKPTLDEVENGFPKIISKAMGYDSTF